MCVVCVCMVSKSLSVSPFTINVESWKMYAFINKMFPNQIINNDFIFAIIKLDIKISFTKNYRTRGHCLNFRFNMYICRDKIKTHIKWLNKLTNGNKPGINNDPWQIFITFCYFTIPHGDDMHFVRMLDTHYINCNNKPEHIQKKTKANQKKEKTVNRFLLKYFINRS